jgi:hypothetical protein
MPFPCFRSRVRTLMIVVAVVALDCAGLLYGPPRIVDLCITLTVMFPVVVPIAYYDRNLGPNTTFR